MNYYQAKQRKSELELALKAAGSAVSAFSAFPHDGPMGMTEQVGVSPEYRKAKKDFDQAFSELRRFNVWFCRTFPKERCAERGGRPSRWFG